MADIDADLLALAGDGDSDSDDQNAQQSNNTAKSESPVSVKSDGPAGKRKRDTSSKPAAARKRVSKSSGGTKRTTKMRKRDDSEEEGEASSGPSSPSSLHSASMSESESDSNNAMASLDNVSKFPIEGKFESEADRAHILGLPEIKREEILAERATLVEREQQRRMLTQLWRDKERQENKAVDKKKRKGGAGEPDDNQRKSSRQKTSLGGRKLGESSAPLEEYKRQREQRVINNEQRKRDDDNRKDHHKRSDEFSDADAEGESEVEWDDRKDGAHVNGAASSGLQDDQPPALKDINHIKVGRTAFGRVCLYPGFEETITSCLVRINIGPDRATGQDVYRVAMIKGFREGRPYAIEGANGKKFITRQYALAAHGKAEREWPFIICSDSPITEAELERYRKVCQHESTPTPTQKLVDDKKNAIRNLVNRSWTEAEIQEKLRRSGALANRLATIDRNAIQQRRKEAIARGDEASIAKCDSELDALDPPNLAFGTSLHSSPSKTTKPPGQQERLAALNRANRKANAADVRKAQLAEKRAEALAQAAVARGEAVANPFARVKTRAKVMYDVNGDHLTAPSSSQNRESSVSDVSRAGTPLGSARAGTPNKVETPKRSGTPLANKIPGSERKKGGMPTIRQKVMDDEIIGAMDLGIEIDI
ncbi:MAG: hypothetical protein M1837_000006 [Sclerophora amabilis]|nr:MAG: hypothetical protein M1837_000006 [Sclerophora amabilis]